MPAGRPPVGSAHVITLDGDVEDKHRLRIMLDVMSGAMSVRRACELLHMSEARFHQLRKQALQGALDALAPRPVGRPPAAQEPSTPRERQLEPQVKELEVELQCALTRTELALAMPQVLMDRTRGSKKNCRRPMKN